MIHLTAIFSVKTAVIGLFIGSILYQHLRGQDRLKFRRQLFNHSALLAPINVLMYLFSAVPRKPYISLDNFTELKPIKDNWQTIREEGLHLLNTGIIERKERSDDVGFNSFLKRGWTRFYLKWYHYQHPSALKHCPKTLALIKDIPGIKAAMFAVLPANGVLNKHRDPYAGSLRYHLGLRTPNSDDCRIIVDNIPYSWRDGEAVMFDETYVHHAYNNTDVDRLIFFCDIERPVKTKIMQIINRFFARYVMTAASSPNLEGDATGGVNKFYRYIHVYKNFLGRIKRLNPKMFRRVKYCLIVACVIAIIYGLYFR